MERGEGAGWDSRGGAGVFVLLKDPPNLLFSLKLSLERFPRVPFLPRSMSGPSRDRLLVFGWRLKAEMLLLLREHGCSDKWKIFKGIVVKNRSRVVREKEDQISLGI